MKNPNTLFTTSALVLSTALVGVPAFAATQYYNPTQYALGFNVFTRGNTTFEGSEIDGAVYIGGNLTINAGTTVGGHNPGAYPYNTGSNPYALSSYPFASTNSQNLGLAINGRVTYASGNQSYLNHGNLRIGNLAGTYLFDKDTNGAAANLRAVGSNNYSATPLIQVQHLQSANSGADKANQSPGIATATAFSRFAQVAEILKSYSNPPSVCASLINQVAVPTGQNGVITLVSGKVNVITLTPAQLNSFPSGVNFNGTPSATTPIVFNIVAADGDAYAMPSFNMFNAGGFNDSANNFTIWNFYKATSVGIASSNSMYGTVFAPNAVVKHLASNNINGQVIASELFTGSSGEIHDQAFTAPLPQCNEPLPVELVSFTGKLSNGKANLLWNTAIEKDTLRFEIEKSIDGKTFAVVGTQATHGSNSSYEFTDNTPLQAGANYYRLKTVDQDESMNYSPVVVVSVKAISEPTSVFPTLVEAGNLLTLNTHLAIGARLSVSISDESGRMVSQSAEYDLPAGNAETIQLIAPTPPGLYFVIIRTAEGQEQSRFIVR